MLKERVDPPWSCLPESCHGHPQRQSPDHSAVSREFRPPGAKGSCIVDAIDLPPSSRCKPVVEALLVHPDALADADDLEILRGLAEVIGGTGRNRQKLGNLLDLVGCFIYSIS